MVRKQSITIPDGTRAKANLSIRRYVSENLDQDIGEMKASFLLDYFLEELGPLVYNQAIADARAFFEDRSADLGAVCYEDELTYWAAPKRP